MTDSIKDCTTIDSKETTRDRPRKQLHVKGNIKEYGPTLLDNRMSDHFLGPLAPPNSFSFWIGV